MRTGLVPVLCLAVACGGGPGTTCSDGLALEQVSVIDGLGNPPLPDHTIVVCDGRIAEIAPSDQAQVARGAKAVGLHGRTVMPGLVDTHAHVTILPLSGERRLAPEMQRADSEEVLRTLLAFGITTVRNPAGPAGEAVDLRDAVAAGEILGPRIKTSGDALNDVGARFGPVVAVDDEAAVRAEIDRQAALGVDYVKIYSGMPPPLVAVAVEQAHGRGLEVVAHLQRTSWTEAARLGVDFITHGAPWHSSYLPEPARSEYRGTLRERAVWLEEVDLDGFEISEMLGELRTRGISIDPTLLAHHTKFFGNDPRHTEHPELALAPAAVVEAWRRATFTGDWSDDDFARGQAAWPRMLELTRRLHEAGVTLTAGSDLPNPWVIPGVSLHEELQFLAEAGIPPLDVVRIATYNGALALGLADEIGSIEVGKRADLVVLAADPLRRLANTRAIEFVLLGGRVLSPAAMLAGDE